jgi:hypothetical protein
LKKTFLLQTFFHIKGQENTFLLEGKYQPTSFRRGMKRGREKGSKCKEKGRKGKEKDKMGRKRVKYM